MNDQSNAPAWIAARHHCRRMMQAMEAAARAEEALLTAATSSRRPTGTAALGTSVWREAFRLRLSNVQLADAMLKLNDGSLW